MNLQLPAFEHRDIRTNGVRLHTVLAGPADGKPVVLLHGFPEFWYGWRNQIPALAQAGLRLIVPDQRGYNLSDKPRGVRRYAVANLAADVAGLIDALGYRQVALAGHDWGAAVAWQTAFDHPGKLTRLAILNVPHLDVMQRFLLSSCAQRRKSWYIFFFQIPGLPEYILRRNNWRGAVRMLRGSGKLHTFSNEDVELYRQAWSQPGAMTAMIHWYRASFRGGMFSPLRGGSVPERRVSVPTLMLWGKKDVALGHEMAQPSIDLCDHGRLVFFEEATHWVQHDESAEVNRMLIQHFSE